MPTVSDVLTTLIRAAAVSAGHGGSAVPLEPCVPTNDARNGDYQSNYAFRLGKSLRTNPRAVAQALVDALPEHPAIAKADVAGPGFLNLHLNDAWLAQHVCEMASDAHLGSPQSGEGRTLVIDFSSPNVAKRMHVGHLRSTIIGDSLARLHRHLGTHVVADNHIGDWGTQFGMLISELRTSRDDDAYAKDPIGELQRLYQAFKSRQADDPSLQEVAREETARLQRGDPENRALWEEIVRVSLAEYDRVYARLGVHFDVTLGESFYNPALANLVEDLLSRGIAEIDDGAALVRFAPEDGKGLAKNPLLIRKSDGAALYGTTDLATAQYRLATWSPDTIVYVTDVRQQLHFRQLFAAARKVGLTCDYQHVWFGMLRLAGGAIASTRSGKGESLVDVLDAAVAHARAVVDQKSAALPEAERATIAEAVGVGAIKYTDLSQNPQSDIVFDWDKMLSLEGNTAPYLMYAVARIHSIFRRHGSTPDNARALCIAHPAERALAFLIARTPEVIAAAAASWRPNLLADHTFATANAFATFYHDCPVLNAPDDDTRDARLALCLATVRALETGMTLLGLTPLTRM